MEVPAVSGASVGIRDVQKGREKAKGSKAKAKAQAQAQKTLG